MPLFSSVYLVLLAQLFKFGLAAAAAEVMKLVSKTILDGRERPNYTHLEAGVEVFKKVTHQMFADILLPSSLKALRRNPDELVRGVSLCYGCGFGGHMTPSSLQLFS